MIKTRIDLNRELKIWSIYFLTITLSVFIHEIGHCIPAWIHGYWAIPTPAKSYSSNNVPIDLQQYISLCGILGTILFSVVILVIYVTTHNKHTSSLLAGSIVMPGAYSIRYILTGRGHDATEFQEAQAALGFSYSGHSLDLFFLLLFLVPILVWILKAKPRYRILPRLSLGFILTIIFIVGLQVFNNTIFDPIFGSK